MCVEAPSSGFRASAPPHVITCRPANVSYSAGVEIDDSSDPARPIPLSPRGALAYGAFPPHIQPCQEGEGVDSARDAIILVAPDWLAFQRQKTAAAAPLAFLLLSSQPRASPQHRAALLLSAAACPYGFILSRRWSRRGLSGDDAHEQHLLSFASDPWTRACLETCKSRLRSTADQAQTPARVLWLNCMIGCGDSTLRPRSISVPSRPCLQAQSHALLSGGGCCSGAIWLGTRRRGRPYCASSASSPPPIAPARSHSLLFHATFSQCLLAHATSPPRYGSCRRVCAAGPVSALSVH
ncbi:hypothetical protein BDV96DRAFT_321077 [Lophiotrema nucula]|uniref:Uncharacterized protein n=1 Tax=Lophiotrema nucula TaxID=690887 RepID=A0A6A5ZKT9_9PLEO|nr:hypothetical protein BDV96DRAFT_321077 [Lophiotrema nucula]